MGSLFGTKRDSWPRGNGIYPHDIAAMMVLFKVARFAHNPIGLDNSIDAAGYAAIMGELATK